MNPKARSFISGCVVGAVLFCGLATSVVRAQSTPVTTSGGPQFTPLLQAVPTPPRWFTGTDGQVHLTYELLLTNAIVVPVTLSAVEVLDAATGQPLLRLDGDELLAATSLISVPAPAVAFDPSTAGAVWIDLPLARQDDVPSSIEHRLTIQVPPGLPIPENVTYTGAGAEVDLREPLVLAPPLSGPGWVAVGSCCDGPHRRAFQPIDGGLYLSQRFAIDFNKIDADNRLSAGDPSLNESYPTYDQPVFAVADATVIAAVDRYPDQRAGTTVGVTIENAEGNHVVLDLGDGRYAFYAHLKPGSLTVQTGDRVTSGQQIAKVGNSGSSDGPHLHFHVMDSPSSLVADGLPYVFDTFELTGQIPPLAEALPYVEAQEPLPVTIERTGSRQNQLPLGSDIVTFPTAP